MRRRIPVVGAALAIGVLGAVVPMSAPAQADGTPPYGGFSTDASATPLRLEVHEPAIPIPADPQLEFDFSYTHVAGSSGPTATARASAMWPGAPVGEGLKTFVEQLGLPSQLGAAGYPVQVNAQSPGSPSSQSQEFLPGMIGRVAVDDKQAVARAGYSTAGEVAGDGDDSSSSGNGITNLLDQLKDGNLAALGNLLGGKTDADPTAASNPLGALSILVSVGGMSASSKTTYAGDSVTATATSQIGEVDLLGGLVKLEGITVSSASTSKLDGGKTTPKVTYGGLTIAGMPFKFTSDGIEAAGKTTAIPGLPDAPAKALEALGISISLPKPTKQAEGAQVSSSADGPTVSIDAAPLLKLLSLNKLPLADLINKFPDQAGQVKSLLLAALDAHPKVVLKLGEVSSNAQVVPAIDLGGNPGSTTTVPPASTPTIPTTGGTGGTGSTGTGGVGAPTAAAPVPTATTPLKTTASAPAGLPKVGGLPGALALAGFALAGGVGLWLRRGLTGVFGGAGACAHGLQSGLPDLRKV